jgi:Putative zinc-finger
VNHLGTRVSALVDGQLRDAERDRALTHVAHCDSCRAAVDAERSVKSLLAGASLPGPSDTLLASLRNLGEPGDPVSPRPRSMPLGPVVPTLPPPGRGPFGSRRDSRRPAGSVGSSRGGRAQRVRYAAAGAVSVAGLVLGTAFAAGGSAGAGAATIVPPAAGLSVEHAATTSVLPLGDPAFTAVTASFGGLSISGISPR